MHADPYRIRPDDLAETWSTSTRVDVTLSLPGVGETTRALSAVRTRLDAAGLGYTCTRALGGWQGHAEPAAIVSMIGATAETGGRLAAAAAISAGCTAVQIDTWRAGSYAAAEWRAR